MNRVLVPGGIGVGDEGFPLDGHLGRAEGAPNGHRVKGATAHAHSPPRTTMVEDAVQTGAPPASARSVTTVIIE